ncbi:MAG: hypothetical protein US50_C0031G0002 [Candidatus Nomurabacteria bacterium GW2011_GWB1_37_5]|uniref:Uncharacterized protein n=1 Tax=Candidatus Nomurabacteria bacterium GW2011_GWB1_37_5 TaxID=1618742 RepID=A0A0G0GXZ3_9BACT|nr:MAG: hypothetical protein US50_C0031G0002 [Candidatus Nomurabacteria bacterium GW2011_GWB1_37_5]
MKKYLYILIMFAVSFIPFVSFAEDESSIGLKEFIEVKVIGLVQGAIIPLIYILAFVAFIWGMFNYIMYAGDEKKRESGKQFILWGLIGLFVMTAVLGIVALLKATFFDSTEDNTIVVPDFNVELPQTP